MYVFKHAYVYGRMGTCYVLVFADGCKHVCVSAGGYACACICKRWILNVRANVGALHGNGFSQDFADWQVGVFLAGVCGVICLVAMYR